MAKIYLIFMKPPVQAFMGMAFQTREAAERYIERFGNPSWEIVETIVHDLELVNRLGLEE